MRCTEQDGVRLERRYYCTNLEYRRKVVCVFVRACVSVCVCVLVTRDIIFAL